MHNSVTGFPVHCTSHPRHSLIVTIWPWATVIDMSLAPHLNLLLGMSISPHVSVSETSETSTISRPGSGNSSWANSAKRLPIGMRALCCRGHVLAASQLTKTDGVPSFAAWSAAPVNAGTPTATCVQSNVSVCNPTLLGGSGANGWPSSDKENTSGPVGTRSARPRILLRRRTGPGCAASRTRWPRYPYRASRFTSIKTSACLKKQPC